jgi:hypothetical protein
MGADAEVTEDGYVVEVSVSWRNLPLDWRSGIKPNLVLGLDIGNTDTDEGEPTTEVVWRGSAENETVPKFGTVILTRE